MGVSSCKRTENDTLGYTPIVPDWCRIRPDLTGRLKHGKCRISAIFWTSPDVLGRTNGAQERTRTFTTLRPLAPEASASTNSATWAGVLWSGAFTRPGGGLSTHLSAGIGRRMRSEEHTSELQSLMRISYAVFCLKKKR